MADLCDLIAEPIRPGTLPETLYLGLEHLASGRLVPIGARSASNVRSTTSAFQPGDVLYGKLRPYLDKAVLAKEAGVCTTELLVLRAKEDVDPRFLAAIVHSPRFVEYAIAGTTGVQHPRTSWAHAREFEVPAFPFDEQQRVADILWLVHEAIGLSEVLVEEGQALKRAAMRTLFTRGLRGEPQKEMDIGLVPESWTVVSLGTLGKIGNGSTPKKAISEYWTNGTYAWLTSAKVYDREIVQADQFVTTKALAECHLPRVQPGAVLIAITGQGKTLGHCAVLQIEATLNQHLAYIEFDQSRVDPVFVRGYLETQYDYFRQVGAGGGSTKGALTCSFLRGLPVPVPPMDEQQEIVAILDAIDRKIDLHRRKRAALGNLFKALLHKLMTGEIRVREFDLSALVGGVSNGQATSSRVENTLGLISWSDRNSLGM